MSEMKEVVFATLPLDYLNELLESAAKNPYGEVQPLITKIHGSVQLEKKEVEIKTEEEIKAEMEPSPEAPQGECETTDKCEGLDECPTVEAEVVTPESL